MKPGNDSTSAMDSTGSQRLVGRRQSVETELRLRGPHVLPPVKDGDGHRGVGIDGRALTQIASVDVLERYLSEPTEIAIETMSQVQGDILLLGAGGKMGPTLARMAKRASELAGVDRRVIAVSRFSDLRARNSLTDHGIETVACDLLERAALEKLPRVDNVIFMTAMKFRSTGREADMWAMNAYLPALVCEHFKHSRIVAFSTGNVYGLTPVAEGGAVETALPSPVGEYAMSCLGRERVFQYFSQQHSIPIALLRLNYACELRYGVLVDLAEKVWRGETIDVTMGCVNAIWQGDANAMALGALNHTTTPLSILNIAGPELLSVRHVCERFAELFDKPVRFCGEEAADALVSNGELGRRLFGPPQHSADELVAAIADWMQRGGELLGKPTRYESRDGRF